MGLLVTGAILAIFIFPTSAAAMTHPMLLFDSIEETPGYQYRTSQPWSGWEGAIRTNANTGLTRDFSNPMWTDSPYNRLLYRAGYARDLGLMYQITGEQQYATKALEALENIGVSTVSEGSRFDRMQAIPNYAIAYDCIQPTLAAATDGRIRDKLAAYIDRGYRDLNEDGTNLAYVTFADFHGQAYPNVATASLVLADYTNPNNIDLAGNPQEWLKCGTDYLFEDDLLHNHHRSLFSFGFDEVSGKHLLGGYKSYVNENFVLWFQSYSNVYGHSIFLDYPVAKRAFTSEVWESLPNNYQNNYCTYGNVRVGYLNGIVNLLPDSEKGTVLWQHKSATTATELQYSRDLVTSPYYLDYLTVEDTSSIPLAPPSDYTSVLNIDAVYQIFRNKWTKDASWLSIITFNVDTRSNRDTAHHDQLSFEYYSHGDLLLADGGEEKYVLDKYYGMYDIFHNTVAVENPRVPFSVAPWSDSTARGFFKGNAAGLTTPVSVDAILETEWMEMMSASATATKVIGSIWHTPQTLTSPINYNRIVLFPNKEYFVVIDRFEGSEPWIYRSIFRPTSLSITPSTGSDEADVGHVNGDLTVGGIEIAWNGLPYKEETTTNTVTGDIQWETTNPYGQRVELQLFTAPATDVLITKHVTRIAGYGSKNEVFLPVLSCRSTAAATDHYRVTALLPRYTSDAEWQANEIATIGTGSTITITGPESEDIIYSGSGTSSFGGYTTDAETIFIRTDADGTAVTLLDGTVLSKNGVQWISLSENTKAFSMQQQDDEIACSITGSGNGEINIAETGTATKVLRDGTPYDAWAQDGNGIVITTDLSEHNFVIVTSTTSQEGLKGDLNDNGVIDIGDVMLVAYMAASLYEEDLNADFNGNGYVDVGDASKINYYYLGLIDEI